MTVVIRRPVRRNRGGNPHVAVLWSVAPASVVIQVSGTDYSRRNIAGGYGIVLPLIANLAPIVEAVGTRSIGNLVRQRISTGECSLLTRMHANGWALTGGFAFTLANSHHGGIGIRIYIESVVTGFRHGESLIRRVNLVNLAVVEMTDMHIQRPLMQLHLHGVVGDIGQGQAAFGVDAQ
jgi:hypothetical protein